MPGNSTEKCNTCTYCYIHSAVADNGQFIIADGCACEYVCHNGSEHLPAADVERAMRVLLGEKPKGR